MRDAVTNEFSFWAIFDKPPQMPDRYVAVLYVGEKPTATVISETTLEALRTLLRRQYPELRCVQRVEGDEPGVIEAWL